MDPDVGWAVNSNGHILHTEDGGASWVEQFKALDDTYFRCRTANRPWVGWNPDATYPLFETRDGGRQWTEVTNLPPLAPAAVCGLSVDDQVVFALGNELSQQGAGDAQDRRRRATWTAIDMKPFANLLIDTFFTGPDTGWVVGGKTDQPVATRKNVKPVVLAPRTAPHLVNRVADIQSLISLGEWGWKIQFLDDRVGFVALENFTAGAILKTLDGGHTWTRLRSTTRSRMPTWRASIRRRGAWLVGGWGDELRVAAEQRNPRWRRDLAGCE